MKRIISVDEKSGLESLLGERVTLFCTNYFYTGDLVGVNGACVLLEKPSVVFETGPFNEPAWKDAQPLPHSIYVMTAAIEAFGVVK